MAFVTVKMWSETHLRHVFVIMRDTIIEMMNCGS